MKKEFIKAVCNNCMLFRFDIKNKEELNAIQDGLLPKERFLICSITRKNVSRDHGCSEHIYTSDRIVL